MNKTIMMMTIKQFWSRKARILIAAVFLIFPFVMDVMMRQVHHEKILSAAGSASVVPLLVLVIGAGIIGQDVSDGILPSILSRPIERWKYVFSKWFAISFLVIGLAVITLCCHVIYAYCVTSSLPTEIATTLASIVLTSFGTMSVMLLLSSLLPGAADVGVVLLLCVAGFVMTMLEVSLKIPGMMAAASNIYALLFPSFDPGDIKSLQSLFSIEVGRYVSVVLVCLCGSIILVNQKELSYGSN
jgi:ABC-type transport system involved in multi-copper enzyme maturation permease subunit